MPAFDTETTVAAAVESVLAQTRDDFELIVVDDGSTDGTAHTVEHYVAADGPVRLLRVSHRGPSGARNAGIAEAVGAYVCFLDSDDLWLPRYLEAMASTLSANPQDSGAYTDAWVLYDDVKRIARGSAMSAWRPEVEPDGPLAFLRALLTTGNFVYYSVAIRREALIGVGGFDERLRASVDYELWLRLASRGHTFARCPELLAVYRRRAGQITADPGTIAKTFPEVFRIVEEEYSVPEDVRALARRRRFESENGSAFRTSATGPESFGGIRRALWRLHRFHLRPPGPVRQAFPRLDA